MAKLPPESFLQQRLARTLMHEDFEALCLVPGHYPSLTRAVC